MKFYLQVTTPVGVIKGKLTPATDNIIEDTKAFLDQLHELNNMHLTDNEGNVHYFAEGVIRNSLFAIIFEKES